MLQFVAVHYVTRTGGVESLPLLHFRCEAHLGRRAYWILFAGENHALLPSFGSRGIRTVKSLDCINDKTNLGSGTTNGGWSIVKDVMDRVSCKIK